MSNLSDLIGGGGSGGGKTADFVATGTIANGVAVVLNSNGTVSQVSAEGYPISVGNASVLATTFTNYMCCAYDDVNDKVCVMFMDNPTGTYRAVLGSISNNVATFGTPVVIDSNGGYADSNAVVFDKSNAAFVFIYSIQDAGNTGRLKLAGSNPSSHTGTFQIYSGVETESYYGGSFGKCVMAYDSTNQQILYTYRYNYPYNTMYAQRITYNGSAGSSSFSYGSTLDVGGQGTANYPNDMVYDVSATKIIICYQRSNYKYFRYIQNNGSTFTLGSEYNPSINDLYPMQLQYMANISKTFVSHVGYYTSPASVGQFFLLTLSGTSFSKTTAVTNSNYTSGVDYLWPVYDTVTGNIGISFRKVGQPLNGLFMTASVSGTTISFGSTTTSLTTTGVNLPLMTYAATPKQFLFVYGDSNNSYYGTTKTVSPPRSNNTEYVGISASAISNSATGTVTLRGGVAENLSSLSPNSAYYVSTSGAITTSVSSQSAGKALSATKLLITGQT